MEFAVARAGLAFALPESGPNPHRRSTHAAHHHPTRSPGTSEAVDPQRPSHTRTRALQRPSKSASVTTRLFGTLTQPGLIFILRCGPQRDHALLVAERQHRIDPHRTAHR